MKVSDAVAKFLLTKNINIVFGYQGGSITHMIDSFNKYGITYVQNYNEQGSSFAADAFSRITSKGIGAAIGTNGPGATNMITGIANAYCDSIPVLFFTGQVHTFAMKSSAEVRQESFQEIDIVSIVKPITKYAKTILDKNEVLFEIDKAIKIATSGRPGPVLIDIPVDVQGYDIDYVEKTYNETDTTQEAYCLDDVVNDLYKAQRPLIVVGGGIRIARATEILRKFVKEYNLPVVVSLMGLDAIAHDDKYFVGFIGSYGNRYSNIAVQNADLILAVGTRLDMRQTGKRKDLFAPKAKIYHIDIDASEIHHFIKTEYGIQADVKDFFEKLDASIDSKLFRGTDFQAWRKQISCWKEKFVDTDEMNYEHSLNPNRVLKHFGSIIPDHSIICADVGQNQMWLAQSLRVAGDNIRILNSGGLGSMGYSLPAAIGAYYASPNSNIIAFMGDGGFQMNIQELQVIGSKQLPITIVVFNNHSLGLIRDVHEKYYNSRYVGSVWGFSLPDLEILCQAYNIRYNCVNDYKSLDAVKGLEKTPQLIEIVFNDFTYVKPELLGNDSLDKQIPYKEY